MKFRNWLLIILVSFSTSLVVAKRIYSSKIPSPNSIRLSSNECSNLCAELESCSVKSDNLQIREHSTAIGQSCMVLCKKGNPELTRCSGQSGCDNFVKCLYSGEPIQSKNSRN
ncbi:hypothetical protein [Leptospira sp. GIMC2001]|uniref:hypothetical protein n=1 Tax=Leptospira sp. GIMC2001 TaxID=1513297 RepID=UPI00234B8AD0|nr:hypothetical protein [Leptospira sp. GIMC2001]WCL47570.1 hypothetical protein O4O04_00975 [Leptospira sp. GIMC2001]